MVLIAAALLVGCLGSWATGGSPARLAYARVRAWPLLICAAILEACLGAAPGPLRPLLAVAACLAVAGWCAANARWERRLPYGHVLVGGGVMLNATVMALNGGMPVSTGALAAAGMSRAMDVAQGHLYKHVAMGTYTRLRSLGDVIPFHLARTVLSPGDVLMLAGTVVITWLATRRSTATGRSTGQFGHSNVRPAGSALES